MAYNSLLNTEFGNNNNSSISSLMPMWLFTNSGSWTCPENGLYRLICIGKGGDGGNGFSYSSYSLYYYYIKFYEACPGAGGGVAIADRELTSGTVLTITVNDSYSSINDTALKATAGGNGYNADRATGREKEPSLSTSPGSVPSGGTASGSWLNYGFTGNSPTTPNKDITYITSGTAYRESNKGGDVGIIILQPAINHNAGIGAFITPVTNGVPAYAIISKYNSYNKYDDVPDDSKCKVIPGGGMAGAGGASGGIAVSTSGGSDSPSYINGGGTGGTGGTGAVLIQRIG